LKFSIIIPTYNRAEFFLKRAIDSVILQTNNDWELIIVDNNSTDGTRDLVLSYNNPKIQLHHIDNNGNIAKSRNLGIKISRGDYIAFLDSDDYWKSNKLEVCLDHLNVKRDYNGLCHSEIWSSEINSFKKIYGPEEKFDFNNLFVYGNCLSLSAVVLEREILKKNLFREKSEINTAEDYDLWLRLSANILKLLFIKDALGYYQIHHTSESSNILKNTNAVIQVLEHHAPSEKILYQAFSNLWLTTGKRYYLDGSFISALKAYLKTFKYNIFNIKAFLYIILMLVPRNIINKLAKFTK